MNLITDTFRTDLINNENTSFAVPVLISPHSLAACTHLDSAYIPEFTNPLSFDIEFDDLSISTWDVRFSST